MGTNYYAIRIVSNDEKEVLKSLVDQERLKELKKAFFDTIIHIGKSSHGWEFCFNHNNWMHYDSLESLTKFLLNHQILDEYDTPITADDFWKQVKAKRGGLTGDKYADQWEEMHPEISKPYYMVDGTKTDNKWFGLRFSTSTEFS